MKYIIVIALIVCALIIKDCAAYTKGLVERHDVKRFLVDQQGTGHVQGAQWSAWVQWSPCTFSGDRYIIERYRKCDNPPPSLFGRDCDGVPVEMHRCEIGHWTTWSSWSRCGCERNHTRSRRCSGTSKVGVKLECTGDDKDVKQCVPDAARRCPINGGWSIWSSWLSCSASCGQGTATRLRLCSNPVPQNGGVHCAGSSVDTKACTKTACPSKLISCYNCKGDSCTSSRQLMNCTNPYCISELTNSLNGDRVIDRRCGTENECVTEWYHGTSDNDRCLRYDPHNIITLSFHCTFCCTEDGCNSNVVPPTRTLYRP